MQQVLLNISCVHTLILVVAHVTLQVPETICISFTTVEDNFLFIQHCTWKGLLNNLTKLMFVVVW